MTKKLDRSRSFGEVSGTGCPYAYEQDGRQFKSDGTEYIDPNAPLPKVEALDDDDLDDLDGPDDLIDETESQSEGPSEEPQGDDPGDGLEALKMKELRARYLGLAGKAAPVATTKEAIIRAIRKREAAA